MRNKLPKASELRHITVQEFCDRMDDYFEEINKQDTALIIDSDHHSYVLCPARWFDLEIPESGLSTPQSTRCLSSIRKKYRRCVRAEITDLCYEATVDWQPLSSGFWEHDHPLEVRQLPGEHFVFPIRSMWKKISLRPRKKQLL